MIRMHINKLCILLSIIITVVVRKHIILYIYIYYPCVYVLSTGGVCIWHSMYALHVYMYVYYYGLFYELLLIIEYVWILCIVCILRVLASIHTILE